MPTQTTLDQTNSILVVPCVASPAVPSGSNNSNPESFAPAPYCVSIPPSLPCVPFGQINNLDTMNDNMGDFFIPSNVHISPSQLIPLANAPSEPVTMEGLPMTYGFPTGDSSTSPSLLDFNDDLTKSSSIDTYNNDRDEETRKRKNHLERNREAAKKCRTKKKEQTDLLQRRYEEESQKKRLLEETEKVLRSELLVLKDQLLDHSECNNPAIRVYLGQMMEDAKNPKSTIPDDTITWAPPRAQRQPTQSTQTLDFKFDAAPQLSKIDPEDYPGLRGGEKSRLDNVLCPGPEVNVYFSLTDNCMT